MIKCYARVIAMGLLLWSAFVFQGCDVSEEGIPAYIKINAINLSVNPVTEGTASHKITDAWVYCDGNLVGVFELPCKFPILEEGAHDIIIKAGIKLNGIAASRGYYPFFQQVEQRLTLVPGETLELNPTVIYYPNKVNYIEAFEDGGMTLEEFGDTDTGIVKTASPAQVFEGAYSGLISLNATYDHVQVATIDGYNLPKTGTPVFLEMNYKTNNPVIVGVVAVTSSQNLRQQVITLNANDEWNKIYINLTGACSSNQSASNFRIYFEVWKDAGLTEATVLIDNLKLVYNE
jgi:hypothetical protein